MQVVSFHVLLWDKTTITDYFAGFVYNDDKLEYIGHEEGRIRPVYKTDASIDYAFDYFEKDHLGNVRVVLTDQTDFSMYAASMEREAAVKEASLFSNVAETRVERPTGYPENGTTGENKFVAKLNGKAGGKKIGPSLVLRVMAGDTVQMRAQAFYKSQGSTENGRQPIVEDLLSGLIQTFSGNTEAGSSHAAISNNTPFTTDFYNNQYQRLKEKTSEGMLVNRPKAYLNFVLFDDNFKLVEDNSGVRQVTEKSDELQELGVGKMAIEKSGFLYVYTSNESEQDVFFDNVILGLSSGPLLEETHYYPYGLTMAGISNKAIYRPENKYQYNGKELQCMEFKGNGGSGLDWYDYGARFYDPVIARWDVIEPLASRRIGWSPYVYCLNNPILRIDPNGLTDFTFDKNTGDVKQVGEKNDAPDRILKTNTKGEIKFKKNGDAKVAMGGIQQGILKDGQNFKNKDQVISVGGKGQPSVEGVKSFTLQLSEYIGKEMKGFSYSSNGSKNVTDMVLGRYINNRTDKSFATPNELYKKYGADFSFNNILQDFHTHPDGKLGATQSDPQLSKDVETLQDDKPKLPNASFIILYRVPGQEKPEEYDYSHTYLP